MNITVSNCFMCINMWSSVLINISKYLGARKDYSKMNCVSWSWILFSWVRQAYKVELWTIISLVFLICTKQLHGKALRRIYTLHRSVFFCSWILNFFCEFWSFNFLLDHWPFLLVLLMCHCISFIPQRVEWEHIWYLGATSLLFWVAVGYFKSWFPYRKWFIKF